MQNFFNTADTIFNITETYPETINVLVDYGFEKLQNKTIRQTIGKTMTLKTICETRKIDLSEIVLAMNLAITKNSKDKIVVKGILPCPIRIPLLDKINNYIATQDVNVDYTLPAASTGLDWLIKETAEKQNLADVYLSAGFGLFFDRDKIGKFVKEGMFAEIEHTYNKDFINESVNFKDDNNIYTILGVVPAVFIVNKKLLGDRKIQRTWQDLFDKSYVGEVAVPMQDLDIFNAVLLNIYYKYGAEGVRKLGKATSKNMHPAQMVKNSVQNQTPLVSIAPYFFASMLKENDDMVAIWPEDGAVASPIFLIAKKDNIEKSRQIIDFLASKEIGSVLSANGKFPSSVMGVENNLSADKKFMFCGFDFLMKNNIGELIANLENLFLGRVEL